MESRPEIGILQQLIVGLPNLSPFPRIFQFGMRHGMRAYTVGNAWWQGDCGPYWGHNAVIRVAPSWPCRLPTLPGKPPLGGRVLSHDQVEAVLMRRAELVRVVADEDGASRRTRRPSPTSSSATCAGARATGTRPPSSGCGSTRWAAPALARHPDVRVRAGLGAARPRGLRRAIAWRVARGGAPTNGAPVAVPPPGKLGPARGDDGARLRAQACRGRAGAFVPRLGGPTAAAAGASPPPWSSCCLLRPCPDHGGGADDLRARHDRRADDPLGSAARTRNLPWGEALHGLWPRTLFGFALGAAVWLLAPDGPACGPCCSAGPLVLAMPFAVVTRGYRWAGRWRGSGSAPSGGDRPAGGRPRGRDRDREDWLATAARPAAGDHRAACRARTGVHAAADPPAPACSRDGRGAR